MNTVIVNAIKFKKVITFTYDELPRTVEPHCYGITSAGNEAIRCYQTAGGSVSGNVSGWHMMTTNKIIELTISQERFTNVRPDYKIGDKDMATIFCEI